MSSIPQCRIELSGSASASFYVIYQEVDGKQQAIDKQFESQQEAFNYILEQGWQVQRERPKDSMIVASRFLKP